MPDIQKITTPEQAVSCACGLPLSKNPHPDAGKPELVCEVGAIDVCIPCTRKALHKASRSRYAAGRQLESARSELETLRAQIDAFWKALYHSWDIEPRAYFEEQIAKGIGFEGSPMAMALHHCWKRDTKVQELEAENERLKESIATVLIRISDSGLPSDLLNTQTLKAALKPESNA